MIPLATFAASAAVGVGKALVAGLTDAAPSAAQAKAKRTADDFEAMFLENSLESVTGSTGTEGPLGENGSGGGVWRSMLTKEYAGQIVKSGGVGISRQIYSEMLKLQEAGGGRT